MNLATQLNDVLVVAAGSPVLVALAIMAATLLLEDAATIATALLVSAGHVDLPVALGALLAGVLLGDLGLYGLGKLAVRVPVARRRLGDERLAKVKRWLDGRLITAVFLARAVPGMRLPTYAAIGFFGLSFRLFLLAAGIGVGTWTVFLFMAGIGAGGLLRDLSLEWRIAGGLAVILISLAVPRLLARLAPGT